MSLNCCPRRSGESRWISIKNLSFTREKKIFPSLPSSPSCSILLLLVVVVSTSLNYSFTNCFISFLACTKALDIGIILDGSSSVDSGPFKVAITFVKQLMMYFDISPQATHAGFILYSTNAKLEFKMSDNRYYSYEKLAARLDEIKWVIDRK